MSAPDMQRLEELLVDRAVHGLDAAENAELQGWLAKHPQVDAESYDLAAAAVELAIAEEAGQSALPEGLRERLDDDARAHVARTAEAARFTSARPARGSAGLAAWSGWLVAAASMLVALLSFTSGERGPAGARAPENPVSLRAMLLERAPDARPIAWAEPAEGAAGGATGDIVWSDALQEGYMRFSGLAANDPSVEQYQLWIFDAERSADYPVDGGVFDVPAGANEVVVPIRARLPVSKATLFAITIEKPGGVVVSSRERLPLLAQVGS